MPIIKALIGKDMTLKMSKAFVKKLNVGKAKKDPESC